MLPVSAWANLARAPLGPTRPRDAREQHEQHLCVERARRPGPELPQACIKQRMQCQLCKLCELHVLQTRGCCWMVCGNVHPDASLSLLLRRGALRLHSQVYVLTVLSS